MRRASHEALTKTHVIDFHPLHTREVVRLVNGILQNPRGWKEEFRR